jgi:DNA-binding protein H-NS
MSTFIETITNVRILRTECRELSLKELETALEKFTAIVEERRNEEKLKDEEARKKNQAILDIKSIMEQAGINPTDISSLLSSASPNIPQKRNVPPKYRFVTANGEIQTWTGQGRTPLEFINCMKRDGKDKDFYLIKDNQ